MMKQLKWFERTFQFGLPAGMLPFYLERLRGTEHRMKAKVAGIDDKRLSEKWEGKWSVKQNIGHLAEVDEIALRRIDEMISGAPQLSPAVFEPRLDYNALPVQEVIEFFVANRTKNLLAYQQLTEVELGMASLHPRLKVMMTPVDLAYFDAEHDDHHLVRINDILRGLDAQVMK